MGKEVRRSENGPYVEEEASIKYSPDHNDHTDSQVKETSPNSSLDSAGALMLNDRSDEDLSQPASGGLVSYLSLGDNIKDRPNPRGEGGGEGSGAVRKFIPPLPNDRTII